MPEVVFGEMALLAFKLFGLQPLYLSVLSNLK